MTKKLSPIMIVHLILMIVMACTSLVSIFVIMAGSSTADFQMYYGSFSAGIYLISILNILIQVCGIIYLLKGYRKNASGYYKAFMVLTAAFCAFDIYAIYNAHGFGIDVILEIVMVVILLVLAFGKDLGKRNTWILFAIILGIDIAHFFFGNLQNVTIYVLASKLSKFLMDGTIGLSIRGKYADKDARGTK